MDSQTHKLREVPRVRQAGDKSYKRWFCNNDMDLFVWFHRRVPVRFQLAYDKSGVEKVISWDICKGFLHYLVDDGENQPGSYKKTPILINIDAQDDLAQIARNFLAACEDIEVGVADFIYARLMELPAQLLPHGAMHTGRLHHQA